MAHQYVMYAINKNQPIMRHFYSLITFAIFLLYTLNLNAQIAFIEDATVPFKGVFQGDAAFADIDGDMDVIIYHLDLP